MSKQYVDVSGWEDAAPQKQYVDVSGWEDATPEAPKESKSFLRRAVDRVDAFMKDPLGNIIGKRDNTELHQPKPKPKPAPVQSASVQEKPKGTTIWDKALEGVKDYKQIDTRFVTSDPVKVKAALDADKKKKEEAHNKLNQQLGDAPLEYPVVSPEFVAYGTTRAAQGAVAHIAGTMAKNAELAAKGASMAKGGAAFNTGSIVGDVGAQAGIEGADAAMDEEWQKENPTAAALIKGGTALALGGYAGYKAETRALNPVAQEALTASETMLKDMGIEVQKPSPAATKDDEIASAITAEYGKPKEKAQAATIDEAIEPELKANEEAKAKAEAEREARVAAAHEEAMARKAELEAQQNPHPEGTRPADSVATKADDAVKEAPLTPFEELSAHPRYNELIEMRRNVSAKDAEKKGVRESDRTILHQNSGQGYETSVIPESDVRNYDYDFYLTKGDVAKIEAGKITPEIEEKLAKDLERLDSDPVYAASKESHKAEALQAKFASVFGNDASRYTMKLIDQFAKGQGISAEEWIAKSGIDFEDLTHTTYGQFKKDLAEADALFQPAYHGTPHNVDKFTTAKIGTGEGAQAYGHGLYFAGDKQVAEWYRDNLQGLKSEYKPKGNDVGAWWEQAKELYPDNTAKQEAWHALAQGDFTKGAERLKQWGKENAYSDLSKGEIDSVVDDIFSEGNLYKVELKPEDDELLLWDKPLSEQPKKVLEALEKKFSLPSFIEDYGTAGEFYKSRVRKFDSAEKASTELHDLGIRGIKYVDGNHRRVNTDQFEAAVRVADKYIERAKASGNEELLKTWEAKRQEALDELNKVQHNYVIFHDDDIEIIGHNGKMLNGQSDELFQAKGDYTPDLIVQHNLSEENLLHAKKMGGIPVPSLAVVKHDQPLTGFGEITMIGPKELADPKGYAKTKVFGADIYSPRYPKAKAMFSAKDEKEIINDLTPYMESIGRKSYDIDVDDLANNVALKAKYLSSRGIEPAIIKESVPADQLAKYNVFKDLVNDGDDALDLYRNEAFRERVREYVGPEKLSRWNDEQLSRIYDGHARDTIAVRNRLSAPDKVDFSATRQAIDDQIRDMRGEFKKYVNDYMQEHNVVEKIYNGTDNMGRQKWIPHTLENVVKKLKSDLRGGENWNYGTGSLRAKYTPQFKSVKDIQANKGKLSTKEDFEAVKKEVEDEFFTLADDLKGSYTYSADGFRYTEAVQAMLDDAASMGLSRALKEHGWKDVPAEVIDDVSSFMERLRHMPTEYFEAKVLREVSPAEFKVAVVPDNIGAEALQHLKDHGVMVKFYKARDEADRMAVIKAASKEFGEDVLFQDEKFVKGMVSFGVTSKGEAQAVIRAFEESDISTLVHETAHVFERNLDDAQRAVYNDVFGHIPTKSEVDDMLRRKVITEDQAAKMEIREEAFAEGFVKWLSEGKAPTAELGDVFESFKTWLRDLWDFVRGTNEERFALNDEMREFYRALMGDEEAAAKLFKGERGSVSGVGNEGELFHAKALESAYMNGDRVNEYALMKEADDLPEPVKNYGTFFRSFGRDTNGKNYLSTPIGNVYVNPRYAYSHLTDNTHFDDRVRISGAFVDTLKDPLFVVTKEHKGKISTVFYKPFKDGENRYHLASFAVDEDGLVHKTFFEMDNLGKVKGMIKSADKDLKYYKHSQEAGALDTERSIATSKSADSESVLQSSDEVKDLFQQQSKSAGGFYSAAAKAIEKMPNKMETAAFVKYLKKNGVKDDEIRWSGIEDALDGKGSITKQDAMEAMSNPGMEKVVLRGYDSQDIGVLEDKMREAWDAGDIDEANRLKALIDGEGATAKYQNYSLRDVGTNYREELTTLDSVNTAEVMAKKAKIKELEKEQETYLQFRNEEMKALDEELAKIQSTYRKRYNDAMNADDDALAEKIVEERVMAIHAIKNRKEQLGAGEYYGKLDHEIYKLKQEIKQMAYKSSHWDEPNVLYHVRKQDTTIDGEKTLLIEEIQSDWHQAGRKEGYKRDLTKEEIALREELQAEKESIRASVKPEQDVLQKNIEELRDRKYEAQKREDEYYAKEQEMRRAVGSRYAENPEPVHQARAAFRKDGSLPDDEQLAELLVAEHGRSQAENEMNSYHMAISRLQTEQSRMFSEHPRVIEINAKLDELMEIAGNYRVPEAPYAKNWHEKALKDQIDEAVKNGYDRVAWVNGKTSADRYSLSKSVDRLVYNKEVGVIEGYKDGESVLYKNATDDELEALIGKDPAKKLMESEVNPGIYEIKGEQLDIGGEGMRGFYDKILVDFAKKYVKKWGAEVEKKTLSDGTEVWSFPVTKQMREDVSQNGQALYAQGAGAIAGVGEDEDGNLTFDPIMALAGAAGVSAVMSKTVRNALSKVAGKTEHLSDSAIRNVVKATIKAADKVTAGTITKSSEAIRKSDLVDYVVGHKIYSMKDYMKLREDALRSANAGMEQAARLHLQLKELSSEAREAMYAYMSGEKNVALTAPLKEAADTFIGKIDAMGKELVDEGILSKEAYEEWKGQYLHRKYASKMKRASDWASGRGEFGVDGIKMRGKTWSADEAEYQELLDADMIGKVSEGKVEVIAEMGDGTYKLRRDYTKEERASMGEIRDIAYSLPETVGRMAQMLHYATMLKAIPKKYILAQEGRSDVVMKGLGYEKLNGSRYGALNGKWVNQSIAGDLKRVANDVMGEEANVQKLWNDYVTAVKMSHTVYNPTAHVNNIGSNVFLQAAAGLNPLKTMKYATDGTLAAQKYRRLKELDALRVSGLSREQAAELSRLEVDADVALWKGLDEHRMFGRSQLNEMLRSYMSPHVDTTAGSTMHAISQKAQALYQGEDDVMRFAAVKQLMNDGLWIDGAVSRMDLRDAMKYTNDTIVPDYSKPMSKLALTLRDSGLVPFMSWTYYSTPILLRQLKDHPTRVLAIGAAWYAMDRLFGVDPYDDESMPKGFAEQRVVVGRDGDKVTGLRVSSMVPHIQLATPANTFLEPLTSGIPQTMLGSATNYNFYFRKPITQKEGAEGVYHRAKDAAMNVLPSPDVIDKAYNLAESKLLDKETRRRDRVFEPRTPAQEAASFFINLQTYDEGNHRANARKEKIKQNKQSSQWERKMDRAMKKIEKVFQ